MKNTRLKILLKILKYLLIFWILGHFVIWIFTPAPEPSLTDEPTWLEELTEALKEANNQPCEHYENSTMSNVPVRCFEHFGIK